MYTSCAGDIDDDKRKLRRMKRATKAHARTHHSTKCSSVRPTNTLQCKNLRKVSSATTIIDLIQLFSDNKMEMGAHKIISTACTVSPHRRRVEARREDGRQGKKRTIAKSFAGSMHACPTTSNVWRRWRPFIGGENGTKKI